MALDACRPLRVNKSFFIVPSQRNEYLKLFLLECPHECLNIKDVREGRQCFSEHAAVCVIGRVRGFGRINTNDASETQYFLDLFDLRDQSYPMLKMYLSSECTRRLKDFPGMCCIYICGASYTHERGGSHERAGSHEGGGGIIYSTADMSCVLVSQSLYGKYKRIQVPVTFVSSIPSSHLERVPSIRETLPAKFPSFPQAIDVSEKSSTLEQNGDSWNISPLNSSYKSLIHTYVHLNHLKKGTRVNIAGCVQHFKPCKSTKKGTSFYRTFSIVDPSLPHGKDITVVAFSKKQSDLPNILRVGDVILLQNVQVNLFRESLQISCNYYSGFMLFDARKNTQMYCKSQRSFYNEKDLELVELFKKWANSKGLNSRGRSCQLCDVTPGLHFDLECWVLSVRQRDRSQYLTVYDRDKRSPQDVVIRDFDDDYFSSGQFVYLYNIHANPVYESTTNQITVELLLTQYANRGICFSTLPCQVSIAIEPSYSVTVTKATITSDQYFVTRILRLNLTQLHFTTLADVLMSTEVPNVFHCNVRVTGVDLPSLEDCVKLVCLECSEHKKISVAGNTVFTELNSHCVYCGAKGKLEYTYIVPLTITDNTASMMVHVINKEAIVLFQNLRPTNGHLDLTFKRSLHRCFEVLMGRNPFDTVLPDDTNVSPRMDCCMYSFYVGPKTEVNRKVNYHLTNTELIITKTV